MIGERGSAVVEFAVVLPLVLVVLLGIVEVAVVARSEIQLVLAAREGARVAAVSTDTERAATAVQTSLGVHGERVSISVQRPVEVGEMAVVVVSLDHVIAAPIFGGYRVELNARSVMRVER